MPFNKKILALVVATTAAMAVGTNVHMELNENNNNSQNKELKVNNEKLLVGSNNEENSNAINDSDTIVMAGNGKAYTDLQNIKFNLNGVPVSGKTITVTDNSGNFIGGGILSNGVVPVSQLSEGQTTLGRKNIIIKVQGCKEPIVIKNKMIGMLNYEVTKVSGLKPGETYTINSYPAAQNQTVTANSNGDVFIKRDNSYSYINLCKDGKVIKSLLGMGPISGDNEEYTIPSLKSMQTTILPYFVIGKGDIIINLGTVNRIFVNSDGKVIKEDTFTGEVGTSIQKADIPKGYEVKSVTVEENGKVISGKLDPTSIGNSKITVIYHLEKKKQYGNAAIKVIDSVTKQPLGNAKVTYNGKTYTTNAKGEVTISGITPGDITVDGSDDNYQNGSTKVEVPPNGQGTGTISLTPDNGTVTIKVVDSKTGNPLSGATVNINGQTLHTNSNGEVQVSNVKPGNISATASDEGYTNGQTSVNLDPNGKATGTISLNPEAGKVVITVNGENGPLKNTKVTVNGTPETTNGEGQVTVKTSEGKNTITIGSENYHNGTVTVDGKPDGTGKANVTLTPDNGTMKITVVDSETKKPLENAKVTYDGKTYTTDRNGEVIISNVTPGDVTVNGSDNNYHSGSAKVEVTPNGQGTGIISLTPDNGTVTIKVVDSKTGKALSGATVNINGQTMHTNSKGEVQVSNVKPGNISATASDEGYTNGQTSVNLDPNGKATGTISLNPEAGKVVITVNGENGPLKNTKVIVNGSPETTNGEGQVTVKTSEGKNTITIGSKNYHDGTVTVDGKPGGTEKANVTLTPDNGTMKITVVDNQTKKPLENAKVTYDGKTYTTNAKGEVTISNVKPGNVTVDGSDNNYHSGSTKVEVTPNGQGTGIISLTPDNGTVTIKVVDSKTGKALSGATVNINGQTLHTNSNGEVEVNNVKPGNISVTASDEGYTNRQTSVNLDPNGKATGTISLNPEAGKVVITVNGENGPLKNTKVTVNGTPETTNGEGQVTVKTSEGKNTITIGTKDYHNGTVTVDGKPGETGKTNITLTPDNGTMKITVVDSETKKPLENAKVTYDGKTYTTDRNGEVTISNVTPGDVTVNGSDNNYHNGSTKVEVTPNGQGTGIISLTPDNGTMKITVVDSETKKPLENAKVTYDGKTYTTNAKGEVTISNVTPGDVTVDGSDNNYHNGSTKVEVTPNGQGTGVISLTPDNGTMKITVVDSETKKPLENAKVTYDGKTYTTNAKGEVTISNVTPGDVTVNGSDNNYQSGSTKVEVTPNGQGTGIISLTPDNGTVTIKVVDSKTGKALSGATVNINGQILHTNSNGEVQVSNVKPGNISATASDKGYTNGQTSVNLDPNGKATGTISLNPEAGKVIVTVNGENGPLKNTKVTVNGTPETTNGEGQVTVKTSEGKNTITIGSENYHDGTVTVDGKPSGTEKANITLTPDNGTMKITVVDNQTKKPLENAKVTYDGKTYTTNVKGEVTISNITPGDVTVDGSDNNYHNGSTKVEVTPNGQGTGIISLTPDNGTVTIKVVDSKTGKALSGATVNINGQILHTNSNGEVEISNVKPGNISATASDKGYTNGQTSVNLDPNGKATGTISLNPEAGKVIVTVNGENGPLKNTKVTVNGTPETTNGEGQVTVKTSEGKNTITIGSENYHDGTVTVDGKPGGTEKANITLTPDNGTVTIKVVDSKTGKALSGATVNINGQTLHTNSNGEVQVSNVKPGDVEATASDEGYTNGQTSVKLDPNGKATGTISLNPEAGKAVITVNGENGPLKNTKVTVNGTPETTNGEGQVTVKTSEGKNTITIGSKNYHNVTVTVDGKPGGTEKANVTLTPDNGTMKITVVDSETKKPLENAKVTYDGKTYTTNAKGEVTISNVTPGDVTVDGSDDNYHNGSTKVEVTPNGQGTGIISLTPDNGTVTIKVVDSKTGKALSGATVNINGQTLHTNSNGEVQVSNVKPGNISVTASDKGYTNGQTSVNLDPNGKATGTISLNPEAGKVVVTVNGENGPLKNTKVTVNGTPETTNGEGQVTVKTSEGKNTITIGSKNYHDGTVIVDGKPGGTDKTNVTLTPDNGTMKITVIDSETKKPLENAKVTYDGKTYTTNAKGEVTISNVKPGNVTVDGSDNNYHSGSTKVEVAPNGKATGTISLNPEAGKVVITVNGENGPLKNTKVIVNGTPETTNGEGQVTVKTSEGKNTITIGTKDYHNGTVTVDGKPGETGKTNITLTPDKGTMKITVVDSETKKPLQNATVTYGGKTYKTDRNGEVIISNVTPGDVTVDGSDNNYHNGSTKVEVTPNGQGTGVISLTPDNGTMKITVVDSETKKPLENAKVTYDGKTYTTNAKGEVTISNVTPGDVTVNGSDDNYQSGSTKVEVTPNGQGTGIISLTPDNGTVTIKVVDSKTGKALSGATVNINGQTLHTNSNGEVQVSNVKPGNISATASDEGYTNGQTSVNLDPNGKATGTISLNPEAGKVVVTVNGENGPLKNTKVIVNGTPETTNGEGQVTVKTSEGKNTITIGTKNYHDGTVTVDGKPGGTEKANIILTPDNGTVTIKVVDSKTGKALSGATVNINGQTLHTNSKGEVQVSNVKPGNISATASDEGYTNGQTSVNLDPNGKATGTISLNPEAGKVIVTVNGENGPLKNTKVTVNGTSETTNGEGQVTVKTSEGKNTITIGTKNYHDGAVTVDGKPGGTEKANVTLTPDNGTMKITVVDSETKKPLENAKVTYNGKTYTTNAKGEATISNVKPGNVAVNGSDDNYHSGSTKVEVTPNGQGTGIISLTPDNGTVTIKVVDSKTGKALSGATVNINGQTLHTNSNGEVQVSNVKPGDVEATASDEGYTNGQTSVKLDPNGKATGTISLNPEAGKVVVTVNGENGPLKNTKVIVNGTPETTNGEGQVTVKTSEGKNTITIGSENYHNGTVIVDGKPGGTEKANITLTPDNGTVTIKVVDSKTGKSLSGATVNINGQTLHTNSDGEVQVSNVKPGDVEATASDEGYTNGQTSVKLDPNGKATGTISLNPEAGKAVITVNGENGPLKNTKVTVNGTPETTNGEGQVTVKTSEGKNTITIGSKNYHNGTVTVDGKLGGTEKANVTLTPDNGTMKITVVDSETKKPLENAKVTYDGKTYTTNAKGEVTISNVTPGDVTVDGSDNNYHSGSTKVEVTPNGQGTGIISLTPDNGTVTIKVVDSKTGKALSGVTVNINGQTLHTNSNGEVEVSNVKPGDVKATASDEGYTNGQTSVNLDPNGKATGTISLNPEAGKVVVTVNGENGPLKNTKVTVNGTPETTNGEGQVTVKTSEGKNTITISSENYHNGTVTVDGKPGGTEKANVTLTPDNGTMKITVVDSETKKPLENAKVTYDGKTYTTNAKGEVTISNVTPGDVTVDGSDHNYHNGSTKVEVTPNGQETGTISLIPDNGTVTIKVVDSKTGKVLSGATVNINGQTLYTNSNGEVEVSNVKPGNISATASDEGYTNGQTSVNLDPNGKAFGIISLNPEAGKVVITVNNDKGPLRNKIIIVNGKEEKTNDNGEVTVGTTVGTNHIKISLNGYNDKNIDVNTTIGSTKYKTVTLTPKMPSVRINIIGKDGNIISSKIVNENSPQLDIPKGYKIYSITVNGEKVNGNNLTKSDLENKDVAINVVNDKNLPNTGINGEVIFNIEELVTVASIIGMLGLGEIFRRKNRR